MYVDLEQPIEMDTIKYIDNKIIDDVTGELSYKDVYLWLDQTYGFGNSKQVNSTTLDILAIYIKGQKTLFTEAKTYCEQKLNALMIPAVIISAVSGVLSLSLNNKIGPVIVSSLNAFNSLLLTLISYLKLDAKSEAHKTSAYKFDKLQALCEFNSGKVLLLNNSPDEIIKFIEEIELKVKEIKETNQFILPEYIRYAYTNTYLTNVFSLVKEIQYQEQLLINKLKNNMNQLIEINKNINSMMINIKNNEVELLDTIKTKEGTEDLIKENHLLEKENKLMKKEIDLQNKEAELKTHIFTRQKIINLKCPSETDSDTTNDNDIDFFITRKRSEIKKNNDILNKYNESRLNLLGDQEIILNEIVNHRNNYLNIDKNLANEININISKTNYSFGLFSWLKS
jgi:hypothetical protein